MFDWKWYLKDIKQDKDVNVFSCFSCGGGSTMGYKRVGFNVIGNCEIDPRMNEVYVKNQHPKYNFLMDLRDFNKEENLPEELFHLDILDGSPPCSTFSTAGDREKSWGKAKTFREGQKKQTLDDLFFIFLDTVEKFPQARERVFFIANNQKYPKLKLAFNEKPILFGQVRSEKGEPIQGKVTKKRLEHLKKGDMCISDITKRTENGRQVCFNGKIIWDDMVSFTITANGSFTRACDKFGFTEEDYRNVSSFPQDYDFMDQSAHYIGGMSVPLNMMANIANEIWEQWLKKEVIVNGE